MDMHGMSVMNDISESDSHILVFLNLKRGYIRKATAINGKKIKVM